MKKIILSLIFVLSFSYAALGQRVITGTVTTLDGSLSNVSVKLKGTQISTLTDMNGEYEIMIDNNDDAVLVFSYVGMESKEEKVGYRTIIDVTLEDEPLIICHMLVPYNTLSINCWSGLFYNPYGFSTDFSSFYYSKMSYLHFAGGYSTNFNQNYDVFGEVGIRVFSRRIEYKFQKTTFFKSEIENRIRTHFLESSSSLKFINLTYGIGHQSFRKKGIEKHELQNYGISLGLRKSIKYIGSLSAKSFYWQNYWAWEANLNRRFFYRKLRLNTGVSYRQIAQDFKEVNLTLGYMF